MVLVQFIALRQARGPFVNDESFSAIQSYTFALLVSGGSDAGDAAGGM